MREWDEIASALLPHYLGWLSQSLGRKNTMDTARQYVRRDPWLRQESAQLVDNIAQAVYDLT